MAKKECLNFNHISEKLTDDDINKFKTLYKTYHKLYKCYLWKYNKLRYLRLALELSSIGLTSTGVVVGSITLNPIVLGIMTSCGVVIQAYLTKSDLNRRLNMCSFAYKNYEKTLIQLKGFLRGLPYDDDIFLSDLKLLDDIISDQAPSIDNFSEKYNKIFN